MITINGHKFYEMPGHCGTCPFLITGNTDAPMPMPKNQYSRGLCIQWDEYHHTWANIPRRCKNLFKRAFELYDDSGEDLVIVEKEK